MPARRIYLDTTLWIPLISAQEPDRIAIVRGLLDDAREGRLVILTSTFTRAEIQKEAALPALTAHQQQRINAYFSHSYITLVRLDIATAELAAEYGARFGMKPADAVHLATAFRVNADVFYSWDDVYFKEKVASQQPLPIERPTWQGNLPLPVPTDDG